MKSLIIVFCIIISSMVGQANETLRFALNLDITTLDPHKTNVDINNMVAENFFDRLLIKGAHEQFTPGLATDWEWDGQLTWTFELREDALFSDGSSFGADDVIASYNRAKDMGWALHTGPFARKADGSLDIEKVSDHKIIIRTSYVYPTLINSLALIPIISRQYANATEEDFDSGRAMVGTGPYRYVSRELGVKVDMETNPYFWGEAPEFSSVELSFLPDDNERAQAILDGRVDVIAVPPGRRVQELRGANHLSMYDITGNRLIYLAMDSKRENSPHVTGLNGEPISNPLMDHRVRKAMSLAISRREIVENVMYGQALASGQYGPQGTFGHDPSILALEQNIAAAKNLLEEVAAERTDLNFLNEGFKIKLHGPNNRYIQDEQIMHMVAAQLGEVLNIQVEVVELPRTQFFRRARAGEFSFVLAGWASDTGETSISLKTLTGTKNHFPGWGFSNFGQYSNPILDEMISGILAETNMTLREEKLQEAARFAMDDAAILPLHFQVNGWVTRNDLVLEPRIDEHSHPFDVKRINQ